MIDYKIGKSILELRTYFKISQRELAKDLCDQSLISRIEKNETFPSAPLLYEISKRLGVDITYFFSETYVPTPHFDYVKDTCHQIRETISKRDYPVALSMIKLEENNPLFRKRDLRKFLLWSKGVCVYYLNHKLEQAITYIDEALSLSQTTHKNYSEEDIEIIISKAVILSSAGQLEPSMEYYEEALYHYNRLPVHSDNKIKLRLFYNMSKNCHERKAFYKAIQYADKGIVFGLQNNQLYLLGHLYYQKGESYLYLGEYDNAIELMNKSLWVFQQTKQLDFYDYVKKDIEKIESGKHPRDFSSLT